MAWRVAGGENRSGMRVHIPDAEINTGVPHFVVLPLLAEKQTPSLPQCFQRKLRPYHHSWGYTWLNTVNPPALEKKAFLSFPNH